MKIGLVLEGGAMRGMFTAGVVDAFLENKIVVDGAIGVSAGACFGINIKSGQIGRSIRYNKKYCKDKRYCSIKSLIKTGDIFGVKFCYETIPFVLDRFDFDAFIDNPMEFYVVATDVVSGKPVYKKLTDCKGDDMQWIRASASMPLVSRVVDIGEGHYLDGGISDSVPLKYFQSIGYEKCITVLTKPRDYKKSDNHSNVLTRIVHHEYPVASKVMKDRPAMYNEQLEYIRQQEKAGNTIVIAPPGPLPVGRVEHDPERLQVAYDIGKQTAIDMLPQIREFMLNR